MTLGMAHLAGDPEFRGQVGGADEQHVHAVDSGDGIGIRIASGLSSITTVRISALIAACASAVEGG